MRPLLKQEVKLSTSILFKKQHTSEFHSIPDHPVGSRFHSARHSQRGLQAGGAAVWIQDGAPREAERGLGVLVLQAVLQRCVQGCQEHDPSRVGTAPRRVHPGIQLSRMVHLLPWSHNGRFLVFVLASKLFLFKNYYFVDEEHTAFSIVSFVT